jgi:ribosomal protein L37AE/L43A
MKIIFKKNKAKTVNSVKCFLCKKKLPKEHAVIVSQWGKKYGCRDCYAWDEIEEYWFEKHLMTNCQSCHRLTLGGNLSFDGMWLCEACDR